MEVGQPHLGQQAHGAGVERGDQRLAHRHPAAVALVVVLGHVAGEVGRDVEDVGVRHQPPLVHGHGVEERLERRARRAAGDGAVDLPLEVACRGTRPSRPARARRGSGCRSPPRRRCRSPGPAARGCAAPPAPRRSLDWSRSSVVRMPSLAPETAPATISVKWGASNGGRRRDRGERLPPAPSPAPSRENTPRDASWPSTRSRADLGGLRVKRRVIAERASAGGRSAARSPPARAGPAPCRSRTRPPPRSPRRCRHTGVRFRYSSRIRSFENRRSNCSARKLSRTFDPKVRAPGIGHPRHLHGDRRSPGHHLAAPQIRDHRPRHRQRIDPRMAIEPLVLRSHQRPPHLGGQLRQPHGKPPPLVRRQEEPQRLPLAVRHHHGRRPLELLPGEREERGPAPGTRARGRRGGWRAIPRAIAAAAGCVCASIASSLRRWVPPLRGGPSLPRPLSPGLPPAAGERG